MLLPCLFCGFFPIGVEFVLQIHLGLGTGSHLFYAFWSVVDLCNSYRFSLTGWPGQHYLKGSTLATSLLRSNPLWVCRSHSTLMVVCSIIFLCCHDRYFHLPSPVSFTQLFSWALSISVMLTVLWDAPHPPLSPSLLTILLSVHHDNISKWQCLFTSSNLTSVWKLLLISASTAYKLNKL